MGNKASNVVNLVFDLATEVVVNGIIYNDGTREASMKNSGEPEAVTIRKAGFYLRSVR